MEDMAALTACMWRPWRGQGLQNEALVYAPRSFAEMLKFEFKRSSELLQLEIRDFKRPPGEVRTAISAWRPCETLLFLENERFAQARHTS